MFLSEDHKKHGGFYLANCKKVFYFVKEGSSPLAIWSEGFFSLFFILIYFLFLLLLDRKAKPFRWLTNRLQREVLFVTYFQKIPSLCKEGRVDKRRKMTQDKVRKDVESIKVWTLCCLSIKILTFLFSIHKLQTKSITKLLQRIDFSFWKDDQWEPYWRGWKFLWVF